MSGAGGQELGRGRRMDGRRSGAGEIGVLLADDDADLRAVYRRLLERTEGFRVVAEAATGTRALSLIRALEPDVALVDVQMPGGSGLDVVRALAGEAASPAAPVPPTRAVAQPSSASKTGGSPVPRTRVVVLTAFDLDEYVAAALRAGAAGFLLKNASAAEVLAAIRAARAGHAALAPEVTARLVDQFRPRAAPHPFAGARLSARELQVVRLVARGLTNQQIADELVLSPETIRTYLKRLFAKLDVPDRTRLAVLAHEAGLLRESR